MKLGATGQFPQGKLDETDEGELQLAIGTQGGLVRIEFGKPVAWAAFPPDVAERLAESLLSQAKIARAGGNA